MRDSKLLEKYYEEQSKIAKEKLLFKDLKKEVEKIGRASCRERV